MAYTNVKMPRPSSKPPPCLFYTCRLSHPGRLTRASAACMLADGPRLVVGEEQIEATPNSDDIPRLHGQPAVLRAAAQHRGSRRRRSVSHRRD